MEEEKTQSKEKSSGRDKATPNPTQESNTKEQQQGGGGSGGEKKKSKKEKSSAKSSGGPKKQQSDSNANNKEVKKESKEKASAKPTKQQESKKEKELELEKTQKGESSTPVTGKAADTPVQSPTTPVAAPSPNPSTPQPLPPAVGGGVAATVSTTATSLASLENDPDTKFFGRKVHIRHLTAGIGAFQIFTIIALVALQIANLVTSSREAYFGDYVLVSQVSSIFLHGIMFIALIILLIGICTKSQSSLLPYISWSFIAIFLYAVYAAVSVSLVIDISKIYQTRKKYFSSYRYGRYYDDDGYMFYGNTEEALEHATAMLIWSCVFMVLFVFSLFLQIWYTVVACYCYKYFLKLAILQHQILKSNFNNAPAIAVTAAVNVPPPQQQPQNVPAIAPSQQPSVPANVATPLQHQQPPAQPIVPQQQQQQQPPVAASTPVNVAPPTPQLQQQQQIQPSTPQPSPLPPQQQQPVAAK